MVDILKDKCEYCKKMPVKEHCEFKYKSYTIGILRRSSYTYAVDFWYDATHVASFETYSCFLLKMLRTLFLNDEILSEGE